MTLIKTSVLSLIATIIKLLSGLVINKAVALFIGPSGLALVGQFQNFSQLVMIAAQAGINNGITKYTAEYGRDDSRIPILFSTSGKIMLISSLCVGSFIAYFSNNLSVGFLENEEFQYIFIIYGFTVLLFALNSLLLSILNGLKEIKTWISINIIQSIYSLIFTTTLIMFLGVEGAFLALATNQSVIFVIVLVMLRKHNVINLQSFIKPFNSNEAKKLGGFAVMTIVSATAVPISHLFIRNHIAETLSWEDAGYWQAIWYVSAMYLMVVTTTLSIYYLPRLAEIKEKQILRLELLNGYKLIMPIVIILSLIIYVFRDLVIWLLFTNEFDAIRDLFLWQLIGNVFKLAAWLVAYIMIAKAMTRAFITTEIVFTFSFVVLSVFLIENFGLQGVTYAFAVNYFCYFFTVVLVTKNEWY